MVVFPSPAGVGLIAVTKINLAFFFLDWFCNHVGDNFAYEARSLHYNKNRDKKKGIYGRASLQDVKELKEEGIETEMLPWIEDKEN